LILPENVTSEDVFISTSGSHKIPVRIYRPTDAAGKLPLYIHLHGGGFHLGNLETEDTSCRLISLRTNSIVANVNYRHAPEWTFPTPNEDVWDALNWLLDSANTYGIDTDKVIIGGTSAGASLACATALRDLENVRQETQMICLTGLMLIAKIAGNAHQGCDTHHSSHCS